MAYLNYGSATQSIVTISLAQGHVLGGIVSVILVQLCWVIAVLLTFPLQIFPVVRLLEAACSFQERHSGQKWLKNLLRTGLVLLCRPLRLPRKGHRPRHAGVAPGLHLGGQHDLHDRRSGLHPAGHHLSRMATWRRA